MKLRIMKCSDTSYWYRDKIGMYYDVLNKGGIAHSVQHDSNTAFSKAAVLKEDAIVFEDEKFDKVQLLFRKLDDQLKKICL
ncbi:hypothetical protein C7M22_03620 [Bacillus velezensis]|nr:MULTISPECIES: hypothetical protein [Bacillus amyloliquefaciens group]AVB11492.1 hypothetical protein C3438_19375 [Bacillus velezensis]MEC0383000.1 hypothetical protein [Bacillus velezensis]MEC2354033.1 hypothetical protein [Bacillus velezensis]QHK65662.1 hypothetical protein C7M22_03620 [Bacillus velezensis]QHL98604.1 hypothetical protein C7M25_02830 [Bacillus velezensis]